MFLWIYCTVPLVQLIKQASGRRRGHNLCILSSIFAKKKKKNVVSSIMPPFTKFFSRHTSGHIKEDFLTLPFMKDYSIFKSSALQKFVATWIHALLQYNIHYTSECLLTMKATPFLLRDSCPQ